MAINSRSKGARTERKVAALMATWTGRKFAKTPASGGLQWKTSNAKGDVVCTTEGHFFPFCIEVKAREKIDFSHLLTPGIKNVRIKEFWDQCQRDAKLCKKVPILMMRYNGLPADFFFLAMPLTFFWKINSEIKHGINFTSLTYSQNHYTLAIVRSTAFFKLPYKEVRLIAREYGKRPS